LVGATGYVSMTSWTSSCTGFDVHSKNSDPLFVDPASTIPDLRLKANMVSDADQNGLQLASVTDDFFGSIRSGLTPNDIGAFAYVFDNVLPTVNITSTVTSPTSINPIPVKITFSEPVTGFTIDDLSVVNGTLSGFAGNGTTYTVNVIPSGQVVVTIGIAAGVATDPAGNLNSAANQFSITYSTVSSVATVKESASIYGSNSSIVLEGTAGQTAVIYSVTGQTVKSVNLTANRVTVPVNKGIFIVRLGKKNVKVIVK